MGSMGYLCVFDSEIYQSSVVPAFFEGETHPLLAAEIAKMAAEPYWRGHGFFGLRALMRAFDDRLLRCDWGRDFLVIDGAITRSGDAKPGDHSRVWDYEDLVSLFERVLTRTCISAVAIMGRRYELLFDDEQGCLSGDSGITNLSPEAGVLIDSLGQRARYWMHANGGYAEGIHGWLTAEEARRLHPLAADFTVSPDVAPESRPQSERFLKLLRQAIQQAVEAQRGLLWGADLRRTAGIPRIAP